MNSGRIKWWKAALLEIERRWCSIWRRPLRSKILYVEDLPDVMAADVIYVIEEDGRLWFAAFRCPCGCAEIIQLNLDAEVAPSWEMKVHENGTVTFMPSIWRLIGCRSHFFVRNGVVKWC